MARQPSSLVAFSLPMSLSNTLWPFDFWRPRWGLERLGVRTHLSFRDGGVSSTPFDRLNLGLHVGDEPGLVEENRLIYQRQMGVKAVFFDQKHGTECVQIDHTTPNGLSADGAYTVERGLACTMMVADCMPLLLADAQGRMVAAVQVGWRGLVGLGDNSSLLPLGVLEQAHQDMRQGLGQAFDRPEVRLYAWLGPCIGPDAFEVGEEVVRAFKEKEAMNVEAFKPIAHKPGKWLADLPQLVRMQLKRLGVVDVWGNDGTKQWCTHSCPDLYFSHRRDRVSGRFGASIWLEP